MVLAVVRETVVDDLRGGIDETFSADADLGHGRLSLALDWEECARDGQADLMQSARHLLWHVVSFGGAELVGEPVGRRFTLEVLTMRVR
jgi:hypothetical protein